MFYKQRDNLFYPTWAFVVPTSMLRLPYSLGEAIIWSGIVYYIVGLAPGADRCAPAAGPAPLSCVRWHLPGSCRRARAFGRSWRSAVVSPHRDLGLSYFRLVCLVLLVTGVVDADQAATRVGVCDQGQFTSAEKPWNSTPFNPN